jgi:putative phosphoribosyl transferase
MFTTMLHEGQRTAFIPAGDARLPGTLAWPTHPSAVVLFAHDVGSGQFCPHDGYIAARFRREGLATLRFEMLTARESGNPVRAFDVALLARRLRAVAAWLATQPETAGLPLGVFGTGLGAAAAMIAAAEAPGLFTALVARSGRSDLAEAELRAIETPTLLLVGEQDVALLNLNRDAAKVLRCPCRLVVVPGATHAVEERGTLEPVAGCATEWFIHFLTLEPAWHAPARTWHAGRT